MGGVSKAIVTSASPKESDRYQKLRVVDCQCSTCGHVFEDYIRAVDETVPCPECGGVSTPATGVHPHPKHSSWEVK